MSTAIGIATSIGMRSACAATTIPTRATTARTGTGIAGEGRPLACGRLRLHSSGSSPSAVASAAGV